MLTAVLVAVIGGVFLLANTILGRCLRSRARE